MAGLSGRRSPRWPTYWRTGSFALKRGGSRGSLSRHYMRRRQRRYAGSETGWWWRRLPNNSRRSLGYPCRKCTLRKRFSSWSWNSKGRILMAHSTITCPSRNSSWGIRRSRLNWSSVHKQKEKWSKNQKASQQPSQMPNHKSNPLSERFSEITSAMPQSKSPISHPPRMKTMKIVPQMIRKARNLQTASPRTTSSRPRSTKLSASLTR